MSTQDDQPKQLSSKRDRVVCFLGRVAKSSIDPEVLFDEILEIEDQFKQEGSIEKEDKDKILKMFDSMGLETNGHLADLVGGKAFPLVVDLKAQMIEEFECETTSQKALAEIAALAYSRILALSKESTILTTTEYLDRGTMSFCRAVSTDLDRAYRQFSNAVSHLQQLKTPSLSVNIKSTNNFLAHNQLNSTPI